MVAPAPTADAVHHLRRLFERSRRPVVLTGAGISVRSGIPDYRDDDGRWKTRAPVTYRAFTRSEGARRRYWARSALGWPRMAAARPNPAHHALAALERAGRIHHLITQNVDGLHQRAGHRRVLDLHGRLAEVECLDCTARTTRDALQERLLAANPHFAAPEAALRTAPTAPDGDARLAPAHETGFAVPPCTACGGRLKPAVVFFGENVPPDRVETAYRLVSEADLLLVVGSSLMVFSGYRFVREARRLDVPVAIVNRGRTRADDDATVSVRAPCDDLLPTLV